jgi:hypothetical protein
MIMAKTRTCSEINGCIKLIHFIPRSLDGTSTLVKGNRNLLYRKSCVGFEDLTAVAMKTYIFWFLAWLILRH